MRTLKKGIELAAANLGNGGSGNLYACGETYSEAVTLSSGVSVYGGFACDAGWKYLGTKQARAIIAAPPALAALLLPNAKEVASMIMDVDVLASDAQEPGGHSIGAFAREHAKAEFRRVAIMAGDGADGADGVDGGHGGPPAKVGAHGVNGADACTADVGMGGVSVVSLCDDGTVSTGGQGGDGDIAAATSGLDGLPDPDPNPQGLGAGGKGQDPVAIKPCTPGLGGAHGKDGAHGSGGDGSGILTEDGFVGSSGADGEDGLPGQGGGGGGATLGSLLCGAAPHGGAGGGSGGSGGCGGEGGKGGQAGGSSFGLVIMGDGIRADASVEIWAGNGGNGGNGGVAQPGGQGGLPGFGGMGFGGQGGVQNGCAGGVGGHGGTGGDGGGGAGGYSIALVSKGVTPKAQGITAAEYYGQPGEGGHGGSPNSLVQGGADGERANSSSFP